MSIEVCKERTAYQGNEVERKVMCCEYSQRVITRFERLEGALCAIADIIRPDYSAYLRVMTPYPRLKLNYCPICGDKYKEAVNG